MNVLGDLAAQPGAFLDAKPHDRPQIVLLVHAVWAPRLESDHVDVPGMRAVNGRDTPARQRVQGVERVMGRLAAPYL